MARRKQEEFGLSEEQIERIADELWDRFLHSEEGRKMLEDKINQMEKLLEFTISKRLMRMIQFAKEDQAKLYAISEIMKANYYEKLKKIENNENEI